MICELLRAEGHRAIPIYESTTVLERAKRESPQLIIADIEMPNMRGDVLALEVCAQIPECRAILMSGRLIHGDIMPRAQHFKFLHKPFPQSELMKAVSAVLA